MQFTINEYANMYKSLQPNQKIIEVTKDYDSERKFEIVEIVDNSNDTYKLEYYSLKNWFSDYYTIHEQQYRRLISLDKLCDDGTEPNIKLNELYELAEIKRKKIQELEEILKE